MGLNGRQIDSRSLEKSDGGRPDARRSDTSAHGKVLHLDLAEFNRDLVAYIDAHHGDPALRTRVVEDARERRGMTRRLDNKVGSATRQLSHRLARIVGRRV